jgi:Tfp pilus assembly major pilin PilA
MNYKYQEGATMWGWMSVVGMIGFIAMLAFKVVPIYVEHRIVRSALQDVVDSREFSNMTNKSIVRAIQSRLTINNVRSIKHDSFKAARDRTGEKYILVSYEQKVSIMSNLSAIVEFDEEIRKSQ